MTGKIKFFDMRRRFGIITPEGVAPGDRDREVFFYEDVLPKGVNTLSPGQDVEFSLLPDYYKPRALTIKLLAARGYVPIDHGSRKAGTYGD